MVRGLTARLRPWSEPLDFDLHVTKKFEPIVPFALHVQSTPDTRSDSASTTFSQFSLLPLELQRHILYFCDSPTLFRLMQVAFTRRDAKKFFWSDPTTWYLISSSWIRDGGHPGDTPHDLSFLAHVEYVNIRIDNMNPMWWINAGHLDMLEESGFDYINDKFFTEAPDYVVQDLEDEICRFWRVLRDLCPRLTKVLVSTRVQPNTLPEDCDDLSSEEMFLKKMFRACPANISASATFHQSGFPTAPDVKSQEKQSVWRLVENISGPTSLVGQWEMEFVDYAPRFIMLPAKSFRGPVGAFQRSLYKAQCLEMQHLALIVIRSDAVERYHFHQRSKPFRCPVNTRCNVRFEAAGEFSAHVSMKHYHILGRWRTPKMWKVLFDAHLEKLERLKGEEYWDPFAQNAREWEIPVKRSPKNGDRSEVLETEKKNKKYGMSITKQASLYQRVANTGCAFLYQLQHDPLYATNKPVDEHKLWKAFKTRLSKMEGEAEDNFSYRARVDITDDSISFY